jgi:FkbM family methyltransferase
VTTTDRKAAAAIPKIVHRIWLDAGPMPAHHELHWQAWQRQLPDHEFRTWRAGDLVNLRTHDLIEAAEGAARKAHIALYEILLSIGGIYLDGDIAPYHRPRLEALDAELVVCSEVELADFCSIAFLAAAPGSTALAWALETLRHKQLNVLPPNAETGPWLLRAALEHGPHVKLPASAFYPYLADEPMCSLFKRDLGGTWGIRVWAAEAPPEAQRRERVTTYLGLGELKEAAQLAGSALKAVTEYADVAKAARARALAAARHALLAGQIRLEDQQPFELLKFAFFLMGQVQGLLVWQLGAGDGVADDPLRALLATFDPPAVLVEPNPHLHERLRRNYARNANAMVLHAAVNDGGGRLRLHGIDPDKARALGLPDWVAGMSCADPQRQTAGLLARGVRQGAAIAQCIEEIEVEALSIPALLAQRAGAQPGIVVIDAGGMEAEIVVAMLKQGLKPFAWQVECCCLPSDEVQTLAQLLQGEYLVFSTGTRMNAYRNDAFDLYCGELYVEHGMPTVYRDALKFVLHID